MEAKHLQFLDLASVVFVARQNTPGLLTHDFLQYNKVVPEGVEPEQAISLPVLSQLKYPGGLEIKATENKTILQFQYTNTQLAVLPNDNLEELALNILALTGHLEYTGLGINFVCYRPGDNIDGLLDLDNLPDGVSAEHVKYKVAYKQFVVHLEISIGTHKKSQDSLIVFNANFSLILGSSKRQARIDAIRSAIALRKSCFTEFKRLIDESRV